MVFEELCPHSVLAIQGLRLQVKLGCSEQERKTPQYVSFDIKFKFKSLPNGCISDRLEETICFAKVTQTIETLCETHEFRLIEKLSWDIYLILKNSLPKDILLWVKATKEKPPLYHLKNGASFSVGDWDGIS